MPIATNDQGDALYLKDGQWVPAPIATNDAGDRVAYDGQAWSPIGAPKPLSVGDVASQALKNTPSSAVEFAKNTAQPFIHPIDTAVAIKNIGEGVLQKFGVTSGDDKEKYADAVGKFFVDRYGGVENIKKTLAADPIGALADLSSVLTLGEGALVRAPGVVGKVGEIAAAAGRVTNPLTPVGAVVKAGATLGAKTVGELGTGAGESLIKASEAGAKGLGSPESNAFLSNLTGKSSAVELVDQAKEALANLRAERQQAYKSGMIPIQNDKTVLDFNKIDAAIQRVEGVKTFKGQDLSPKTREIRADIKDAVSEWRALDPAEFHTPEGLDALKQKVGDIVQNAPPGSPSRVIGDTIYKGIWQTIKDQAPTYAKVMGDYEDASNTIREIQNTLSLKPNANVDTAVRKLYSVFRNNANTNYGRRAELLNTLEGVGAQTLPYGIAGQSLSTLIPRGLIGRGIAAATAGGGAFAAPHLLAAVPFTSPAVAGLSAYGAGLGSRVLGRPKIGLGTFQTGRQQELR